MQTFTIDSFDLSPDELDRLTDEQLSSLKQQAEAFYALLQSQEPDDPESPECMKWLESLSLLEDLLEEIDER